MHIFEWVDAISAPDRVVKRRYNAAKQFIVQGRYTEALPLLNSAIRMNPTDPYLHANRGVVLYHTGDYEAAIHDFTTAIHLGGIDSGLAYYDRALANAQKGNIDAAIRDYAEALNIGLDMEVAIYALEHRGQLLILNDELQRAERNFEQILNLNPDAADKAYIGFAVIRSLQRDYDGAIDYYSKALAFNSGNEHARYGRGYAYLKKKDWEAALADYEEYVRRNPSAPQGYNNRGFARIHLKNWDTAKDDFEQVLALDDKASYGYAGLGDLHFLREEYEFALEKFKKAHELDLSIKGITASLAVAHYVLNQVDQAVEIWRKLVDQDSNYRDIDWVRDQHMWPEPLIEEARKLIALV